MADKPDTLLIDTSENIPEIEENLNSKYISCGNPQIDRSKLSKYDAAALTVARLNPTLTPNAIGVKLQQVGLAKSSNTIFRRMSASKYLRAEITAVRKNLEEQLIRECGPAAVKTIKGALKSKDLHYRDKSVYAKMALDKIMADKRDDQASPVQIGNIERLQVLVQGALLSDNNVQSDK